jgi:hypothetical protein
MAGVSIRWGGSLLVLLAGLVLLATAASAADRLGPGAALPIGGALVSPNGQFRCLLQPDGNLVVYRSTQPIWYTGTAGQPIGRAVMQPDGNFVLVRRDGRPAWWTGTAGYPNALLVLRNDGGLALYHGNRLLWQSAGGQTTRQGRGAGAAVPAPKR